MKILSEKVRVVSMALLLSSASILAACSTGTKDGDVSVEESDYKDKNPNEHNESGVQSETPKDSAQMDDAYEKTDGDTGARDKDLDGLADEKK